MLSSQLFRVIIYENSTPKRAEIGRLNALQGNCDFVATCEIAVRNKSLISSSLFLSICSIDGNADRKLVWESGDSVPRRLGKTPWKNRQKFQFPRVVRWMLDVKPSKAILSVCVFP
jgi:hypothetical protein